MGIRYLANEDTAMSDCVKKHPALSLLAVSMVLGTVLVAPAATGLLPPAFMQLGAMSASVAAIILVAIEGRRGGIRELLGRALIWRVGIGGWAFALLFTALVSVITLALVDLVSDGGMEWSGLPPLYQILPTAVVLTILAGLGEEFGWRGFLIPRLQKRHSALIASLIIGIAHSAWHLPLFLVEGTAQYDWAREVGLPLAVLGYSVFVIAWAIQMTWVFNNTRGSVLLVAVVHGAGNAWIGGYFDVHGRAGITGNLVLAGVMAVTSIIIVVIAGPKHLSRSEARATAAIGDQRIVRVVTA